MSPGYLFYNAVISLAGPLAAAAALARGRLKGHWPQRLGFASLPAGGEGPRLWVHAASVGEVQVAAALMAALSRRAPGLTLYLSTTTAAGLEAAREQLPKGSPLLTFPFDFYGAPGRALARVRPDLVILLETELWPNFIRTARNLGARIMLANGRISARSAAGYRRLRFLFREVLSYIDLMAMIRPEDRARVLAMGADPARVQVAGNAKYDLLLGRADQARAMRLSEQLGLAPDQPVLVAGSTRAGEESQVLDVFQRLRADFPRLHLILAPRHTGRADQVESLIRSRGLPLARRSRPRARGAAEPAVTLVDVMGELFYLYPLATAAFCGASLVPLGGQNPLEPAVWGRPVLYGPSMEDFLDARQMLEAEGAGQTVADVEEFYQKALSLLSDPEQALERGRAGRRALEGHRGAAERLADSALGLLG